MMFLSCTGVRGGHVLDNMAVEAPIKQALIAASQRIVLLASEIKFPDRGAAVVPSTRSTCSSPPRHPGG
jgi:DeoR/GlpR family transcriptional regulator of sugar metabolism